MSDAIMLLEANMFASNFQGRVFYRSSLFPSFCFCLISVSLFPSTNAKHPLPSASTKRTPLAPILRAHDANQIVAGHLAPNPG
jgi:hypothetical protein